MQLTELFFSLWPPDGPSATGQAAAPVWHRDAGDAVQAQEGKLNFQCVIAQLVLKLQHLA